jgi:hypothetical protein
MSDLNAFQPLVLVAALEWAVEAIGRAKKEKAGAQPPAASRSNNNVRDESKREVRQ